MQNFQKNHAIWIGLLLLGVSAWGNLHPPFVMPGALFLATMTSGLAVWRSYRPNAQHRGKILSLPGFAVSLFFLGHIALTPLLDSAAKYEIVVDGLARTYRVRTPSSYGPSHPRPVLLVFHGYNQTGHTIERLSRLDAVGEQDGFIVVYPEGFKRAWRTGGSPIADVNDIDFVRQLIADLKTHYTVDSTQVFAVGFSNGGSLALSLACEADQTVSAIVAIGARLRDHQITRCQERNVHPVPAMFVNGTEDRFVGWEGTRGSTRRWAGLLQCQLIAAIDTLPDDANDGTRVWRERYDRCPGQSEAVLYAVEGAGHTWPNGGYQPAFYFGRTTRDFDSGAAIAAFLRRVTKRGING